ncbi:MAG: hypothetical protein EDM75_04940 [Chlorobiota bacterium]|nr:MAG: hypothetical protein EDM75_04940 [Chlorobiota bacterium]
MGIDGVDWCNVNPEAYFKSLSSGNTPASVDCLFTNECDKHGHDHNLIELKSAPQNLNSEFASIYKKFEDTIDSFMCVKFADIYNNDNDFNIYLTVVHRMKNYDRRLLLKQFKSPIRRFNRNLYIDFQKSPYTITKC